jgi:hypothetical protein|tara:strand:+ start:2874 stop:3674 length:801 start_codon:yes stop_codon:yes gene_type:complete
VILNFIKRSLSYLIRKFNLADLDGYIYERRMELAVQIDQKHNSTIQYGPFKGMLLSRGDWWGKIDRPSMIYGFYEQEVLESLTKDRGKFKTLIDVGAADGYYAIGGIISKTFEKSICYEIAEEGQNQIRKNAKLNNVSDKVEIRGEAKRNFHDDFSQEELSSSIILMDIEGVEFDLFAQREDFLKLKHSTLIIESHALYFDDGDIKQQNLISMAQEFFDVTELKTGLRDFSNFTDLRKYSDSDRWLMCSEGRGELMSWLRLDPKKN